MKKLTPLQAETMEFCQAQVDEARRRGAEVTDRRILDAQKGIVYTQGGLCTIRTLRVLERYGLLEVLEDNSGIGTSHGAFPSKVRLLRY